MLRRDGGQLEVTDPDGGSRRYETYTCAHCNRVVFVKHKMRPEDMGGLCKICMDLTCPQCHALGACTPFEKKLELQEKKGIAIRSYGL
jgi:hypothetical protein